MNILRLEEPSKHSLHPERQMTASGAVLVEFALVAIVSILLIFTVLEVGRFVFTRGYYHIVANRALSVACVAPGLDDEESNASVIEQIETFASRQVSEQVQSSLILPAGDLPLKELFNDNPIIMSLNTEFHSIIPFLDGVQINEIAVGYREPYYSPGLPVPSDCNGNPLDLSNLPSDSSCCGDGQILRDGVCGCTGGYTKDAEGNCTICVNQSDYCQPGEIWNRYTCQCEPCRLGLTEHPTTGRCHCINDLDGQISADCDARHDEDYFWDAYHCYCRNCQDRTVNSSYSIDAGRCVCTNTETASEAVCNAQNMYFNDYYCYCGSCPEGTIGVGTECQAVSCDLTVEVCQATLGIYAYVDSTCVCTCPWWAPEYNGECVKNQSES
jgi:hypothetical protein